jgi:hypothetical protein
MWGKLAHWWSTFRLRPGNPESGLPVVDASEITFVRPDPEQLADGLQKLEECLPYWRNMPALLAIKPELAVVVSVTEPTHDEWGFALRLSVDEKLVAPPGFDRTEMNVGCTWNQPCMSFDKRGIFAPYAFSLTFGSKGVARARAGAREFREKFGAGGDKWLVPVLRSMCEHEDRDAPI